MIELGHTARDSCPDDTCGTTVLSLVSAGLASVFVVIVAVEHILVPELDPLRSTISEYANATGAAGMLLTAGLAAWSTSLACLAMQVGAATRLPRSLRLLALPLAAAAAGFALAAGCPTQAVEGAIPVGVSYSTEGRLHDFGAGAAEVAIFAAAVAGIGIRRISPRMRGCWLLVVAIAIGLGPAAASLGAGDPGLRQRLLLTGAMVWQISLVRVLARGGWIEPLGIRAPAVLRGAVSFFRRS